MAAEPDKIYKEMPVKDLGHFIAYNNRAIKAVFEDRTIVRMMQDCRIIRVLNRRGDELLFNLDHPNPAQREYEDYITVSREFFEWAFLTQEQKQEKEQKIAVEKNAIESEMERI